jgi:Ca2+-binding EF-hand superfamily protein
LFDTNGSGTIDLNELKGAIEGLGTHSKNQLIVQMMGDIENSTNRQIDFEEFLDLMTATIGSTDTKEETSRVFNLFDDDRTGYISLDNLKRVAYDLGETMDDAELLEMIEMATDNRKGVTFDDFFSITNKKTFG